MKTKAKLLCGSLVFASGLVLASENYEEARVAYERGHYVSAHAQLLVAANKGDPASQELLAFMYLFGPGMYPGVARDLSAASFWFERAARSGRSVARYLSCALHRREAARRPGPQYCFDRIAETGEPAPRR
jgi:TPR repeat protein